MGYANGAKGLSAPQVGVNLRVVICNAEPSRPESGMVFVNPRILEFGGLDNVQAEMCASFPQMRATVKRPSRVTVQAIDCDGRPFTRALTGAEARLFQHEYDHLNGIVYIDRLADDVRERLQPNLDKLVDDYLRD